MFSLSLDKVGIKRLYLILSHGIYFYIHVSYIIV